MGKEIEVRHVLNSKDELMKWLNGHALSCARSHQNDTYYDNRYHSFATDQKAHVTILDMQLRISISDIMDVLEKNPPNLIGISISFGQKNLADELLTKLKDSLALKDSVKKIVSIACTKECGIYE